MFLRDLRRGLMKAQWRTWSLAWLGASLALFAWLLLRTAWVSDDAFISLRTASNLLQGYGLRWNVSERVQTFTHPLWLFFLTGAHAITNEPFYSTIYLSWIVSCMAVAGLLFACPGHVFDKTLALFVLAFSQAFVDFSSSGLENPLTHLLVVAFVVVYVRCADPKQRALGLSSIAGLAVFNRLDSFVLFAPALAHELWRARKQVRFRYYLVGALPLLGWEAFSVLYYGFPFPNTAYAKLAQDQASSALLLKGIGYLYNSVLHDPLTVAAIAAVFSMAVMRAHRHLACLALGAIAYLLYVIRIGGDFMSGRFLSAPLLSCALCWVIAGPLKRTSARLGASAVAVLLAVFGQYPPPLTGADFARAPGEGEVNEFGIHNERRLFFAFSSLRNAKVMTPMRPDHPWSSAGFKLRAEAARSGSTRVEVIDAIGYVGYFAGPRVHIVDHWALADALIARLPPVSGQYGHYPRVIPVGYLESLATREERLVDPHLRAYYRELASVIRSPLLEPARLRSLWRLNTGQLAGELDRYEFIRDDEVLVHLRFTNPSPYRCVTTYVWNDERTTAYTLDATSQSGKSYDITWHVAPHAAALLQPSDAAKTSEFKELADRGFFSVAVALSERVGGPIRDLHELRYTYHREANRFAVQQHPWPAWTQDFPRGRWIDGRAPGVLLDDDIRGL